MNNYSNQQEETLNNVDLQNVATPPDSSNRLNTPKKNIFLILIFLFALLCLISMGYFYFQNQYLQQVTNDEYVMDTQIHYPGSAANTEDRITDWEIYNSENFSLSHPSNWQVSTRQMDYYDSPTLELTKIDGMKMADPQGPDLLSYELPEIWIGSFVIYSTSGSICSGPEKCSAIDTLSFVVKGKNYSTDVFQKEIWESGKFIGKYIYVFQIGSSSELDSIPSKPTITGQYNNLSEKSEIEDILSSIDY